MSILGTTPPRRSVPGHTIGNYIVDFCAPRRKLIIELDGSQHLEQQDYDEERTKYLEALGYRVLRFWNNDVMNNMDAVLRLIWNVLQERDLPPFLSLSDHGSLFWRLENIKLRKHLQKTGRVPDVRCALCWQAFIHLATIPETLQRRLSKS